MEELGRIQTFVKVVEAGSFSAAARDVSSVSWVARQVKSLEDELGVRLLNRSTRRLSLTEAGRRFYEQSCALSRDLGRAMSEAKSSQDTVKGQLRVQLRVSAGTTLIVPALPAFLAKHPGLSINITLADERCDLIANDIDVAVWAGRMPDSEIVSRRLAPSKRIVCGSPAYLELYGVPKKPEDLKRHRCLRFTQRSYGNSWAFSKDGEQEEVHVQGDLSSDNGLVLLSAVMGDLGLMVAQEWMVRVLLSEGRLVRVLGDYTVNPRPDEDMYDLYAVYASSRGLARKVRAFVDFLVELFSAPADDHPA
ncbi:LysR family transcriptional regulator [Variovorax guangxiensis]|uniref:LysR family transcriptional regulator n=1 Tax=Variovorax guangxiensis TaxID=1775474 RepID=UPI002856648A|nr:LysR family transcriptional regulator [Variovorax guangxiensis]MDR6861536.1 DNA-binding transcriptional LysR family regulator [Variovorax guangxiensis]